MKWICTNSIDHLTQTRLVFWNVVKVVFHPALICCSLQGLFTTVVHDVCAHTFLSLCLSFLSYWNPFYRRILPRVSAGLEGVNPSLGGSLLRQQPIWQSIASHSPSSLQSANHRAGDDGQPWRSPSLSPSLLSAPVRRTTTFCLITGSLFALAWCPYSDLVLPVECLLSLQPSLTGSAVYSVVLERMLCLCGCCVWGWACVCCTRL